MSAWGVLVFENNRHRLVKDELERLGFQYFLPVYESLSVVHGRHVRTHRPLLGRYLFFIISDAWRLLFSLRGVEGVMLSASNDFLVPALACSKQVEYLQSQCVNNIYRSAYDRLSGRFVYGQRVRPKHGPFEFKVGRFDGYAGKKKYAAMFDVFGREQRIVFSRGELVAV